MALAQPSDVGARLPTGLDPALETWVGTKLEDIELHILNRIPDLLERAGTDEVFRRTAVMVEAEAVCRVVRNPDGYRQEQAGDYMYTLDARVASGQLRVTDDEWRLLGVSAGAFTIAPKLRQRTTQPDPWA